MNNHAHVLQGRKNVASTLFLKYAVSRTDIEPFLVGGGRAKLNAETMITIGIKYPGEIREQYKIGAFFRDLDGLITLHQCRYFFKKNPMNSFRLKNNYVWEQRKLKDISEKVVEKNSSRLFSETFTNSAENGIVSQRDFFDHDISNANNIGGYYVVRSDDFVYNPRISITAPVGPINRNKLGRTGIMSPLYTVFHTHDVDNTYLEFYFKSHHWHSFMFFNGDSGARADRFSIKDAIFVAMPIPHPCKEEQKAIGNFLKELSYLITLHQRK